MDHRTDLELKVSENPPIKFIFLLLNEFTLLSLSAALDTLRVANRLAGRDLFSWMMVGEGGEEVVSSSGAPIRLDDRLPVTKYDDVIVVCGGTDVQRATTPVVVNWLRREARRGATVAGLSTGAYAMASAGLLIGKKATVHWELQDIFAEQFPSTELTQMSFEIDRNRITTAGGTSSVDMCLAIISSEFGEELAAAVAEQLLYSEIRDDKLTKRLSLKARFGSTNSKVNRAIEIIEEHLEEPINMSLLAEDVGLSLRQLERLFKQFVNRSPKQFQSELRLRKAQLLLQQSDLKLIDIAMICGFSSAGHFSKRYKQYYNEPPSRERKDWQN